VGLWECAKCGTVADGGEIKIEEGGEIFVFKLSKQFRIQFGR
jgi:ribosomal protein L37AE/L43A